MEEPHRNEESAQDNVFEDVYYQEFRPSGSLIYTGDSLVPCPYEKEGYPGKDSTSYEYVTYNEEFSAHTIIFNIPISHLRKR